MGRLPSPERARALAHELLDAHRGGSEAAQERFARLHPRFDRPRADATLGDARLVVAREHGFDNWPRFRVSVEAGAVREGERVHAFLESSWAWGDWPRAQALLAFQPEMAEADLYAACVLGSEDEVARRLSRQPELAQARGGPLSWPPLLYVCWSAFLARDPGRSDGLLRTAHLLLEHGDPKEVFIFPDGGHMGRVPGKSNEPALNVLTRWLHRKLT